MLVKMLWRMPRGKARWSGSEGAESGGGALWGMGLGEGKRGDSDSRCVGWRLPRFPSWCDSFFRRSFASLRMIVGEEVWEER